MLIFSRPNKFSFHFISSSLLSSRQTNSLELLCFVPRISLQQEELNQHKQEIIFLRFKKALTSFEVKSTYKIDVSLVNMFLTCCFCVGFEGNSICELVTVKSVANLQAWAIFFFPLRSLLLSIETSNKFFVSFSQKLILSHDIFTRKTFMISRTLRSSFPILISCYFFFCIHISK